MEQIKLKIIIIISKEKLLSTILSEKPLKQTTIVEPNSCCKRFQRKPKKRKRPFNDNNRYRFLCCPQYIIDCNNQLRINNTKVMLIDVMANNVMLSKNIERSQLLISNSKALNITDYCFELSPHNFGGPPPLYVHQLEEINEKKTIQECISGQLQQLQDKGIQYRNHQNANIATTTISITANKNNDDKS